MIIGLTSDKYGPASSMTSLNRHPAKLSQIEGVGQVNVGGGALPSCAWK